MRDLPHVRGIRYGHDVSESREAYYRRLREERERSERVLSRWETVHWWTRMVSWIARGFAVFGVVAIALTSTSGSNEFARFGEELPTPLLVVFFIVWGTCEVLYFQARQRTGPID